MNSKIKQLVKQECDKLGFVPDWYYRDHLLAVEKFSKYLLKNLPKANKEIVILGVWLHDLQGIRGLKGDHQKVGAREAGKIMKDFNYDKELIKKVKDIILTHACYKEMPTTIEGKILASADAMAHYFNDYYLIVATSGEMDLKSYKKWALEKLNRDYNKKIFFNFAKKKIKKRHDTLMNFFTMR